LYLESSPLRNSRRKDTREAEGKVLVERGSCNCTSSDEEAGNGRHSGDFSEQQRGGGIQEDHSKLHIRSGMDFSELHGDSVQQVHTRSQDV